MGTVSTEEIKIQSSILAKAREVHKRTAQFCKLSEYSGILYWDKIQNYNLMQHFEDFGYAGVNPCAKLWRK